MLVPAIPSAMQWCTLDTIAHRPAERLVVTGCGQRGTADVVTDVEAGVVDPDRLAEVERHGPQLLPVPRDQRQLATDVGDELLVAGRWPFEHGDGRNRH